MTSALMASHPGTVDLGELDRNPEYRGVGSGADAVEATRRDGEAWLEACAAAIAEEARWLLENYPKQPERHKHRR